MSNKDFFQGAQKARGGFRKRRPMVQTQARRLTAAAPNPYRRDEVPNSNYPSPGRGVSGESTN